jgi:hypothetical protein
MEIESLQKKLKNKCNLDGLHVYDVIWKLKITSEGVQQPFVQAFVV